MNPRAQSPSGKSTSAADIGVWGLGTMGGSLALNFAEHGFTVALHNRSPDKTLALVAENRERPWGARLVAAKDPRRLVEALGSPRRVLLMVPAGPPVDQCLAELTELLAPGDVIVDGGNSLYTDTERRAREAAARKLHFVGCGVSGGEEGARHGPSLMPGGDPAAYALLQELLSAIAADGEDGKCVTWVGPGGAGHFVKMAHNGIEYADMQLLAEAPSPKSSPTGTAGRSRASCSSSPRRSRAARTRRRACRSSTRWPTWAPRRAPDAGRCRPRSSTESRCRP
jgi:6-phosphogluconate dehydrogenase